MCISGLLFYQSTSSKSKIGVKNVEHSWLLWLSKTMVSVPEGSGFLKNWIEEGKICVLVFVPYKSVQI